MIARRALNFYPGEFGDIVCFLLTDRTGAEEWVRRFEEAFAEYLGVRHAVATCTGRYGLELALRGLDLPSGSEVLAPAYTLGDLLGVVRGCGLVPVAVDVDPRSLNLDPQCIAAKITPRTRVVLATHLFGAPCDLDPILEIARRRGLKVIEDCAHAAGATYRGRKVGSLGDAAFFSFEVIKPLNAFGGGMVATNSDALAQTIRSEVDRLPMSRLTVLKKILLALADEALLRSPIFGPAVSLLADPATRPLMSALYWLLHRSTRPRHTRFTGLQAFLGLKQLPGLDARNAARRARAAAMTRLLGDTLQPQSVPQGATSTHYFYVALARADAAEIRRKLLRLGVASGVGAEITDDCAALLGQDDCPHAARVFGRALQIPIHSRLTPAQMRLVARAVKQAAALST